MKYLKPVMPVVLFFLLSIGTTSILMMSGCKTSQQQVSYNTIWSLENLVTGTYDGYTAMVINGSISTNSVPKVSKAYNTTQASLLIALDATQFSTNALASPGLTVTVYDFINLVNVVKKDIK